MGQVYSEFQQYLKELKKRGILLNVVSKNDRENAIAGLNHPDGVLKPDDFISIKANWEPKSVNLVQMARELALLCHSYGVPLIVNDSVEVALSSGADGVHLGQGDMDPAQARKLLGPWAIIGVTARTVEQAKAAQAAGADYLGSGAVFPTGSKGDAVPMAHETLKAICAAVSIPVYAIGGISPENIAAVRAAGAAGACVMSGLMEAADPAALLGRF